MSSDTAAIPVIDIGPLTTGPEGIAVVAALPSCVSALRPASYPPIEYADYEMRLRKSYEREASA